MHFDDRISIRTSERKKVINIGFVSADFTDQHSTFYFLKNTLEFLDKKKFKIFLFSYNRGNNKFLGQEKIKNQGLLYRDIKKSVSAKFLHTLNTIKSVYMEFLELIKNRVSAKSVLKEAVYNKALL